MVYHKARLLKWECDHLRNTSFSLNYSNPKLPQSLTLAQLTACQRSHSRLLDVIYGCENCFLQRQPFHRKLIASA